MVADLIRSPAVRLLQARQDHAVLLGLAASYRLRIATGETDQREAHAWALGLRPALAPGGCQIKPASHFAKLIGAQTGSTPSAFPACLHEPLGARPMTHARILAHDTAVDPIHAAILHHRTAYDAYQVAPEGKASVIANDDYDAATDALVTTPCASRFGALALLGHLRWWICEEAEFSAGHQPGYGIAQARVADLALFLGTNLPPAVIPQAFPSGRMPTAPVRPLPSADRARRASALTSPDEALSDECTPWEAVAAIRPDTAFVRSRRFIDAAGDFLAALVIIGGGGVLTSLASLI